MGEYAEMLIDGAMCQSCGQLIDGEIAGHARFCPSCGVGDLEQPVQRVSTNKRHRCDACGKRFRTMKGVREHARVVHGK